MYLNCFGEEKNNKTRLQNSPITLQLCVLTTAIAKAPDSGHFRERSISFPEAVITLTICWPKF